MSTSNGHTGMVGKVRRAVIGLPLDEPIIAAKKYNELDAGQKRDYRESRAKEWSDEKTQHWNS